MSLLNFRSYFIFFSLICAPFVCVFPAFSQETEQENNNAMLSEQSKEWITNWVGQELPPTARELNIFKKISSGMTMKGVFLIVGLPDFVKGSGFSIFTYTLNDGSEIWIGAADMGRPPLYVTHFTIDGRKKQLLSSAN